MCCHWAVAGRTLCFVVYVRFVSPTHKCRRIPVQEIFSCYTAFFSTLFVFVFLFLFTKQFALLVGIFTVVCFAVGGSARVAALFCCSVVFFALPFNLGIDINLWQLVLLFLFISSPIPYHFGTQNIRMYVALLLVFRCTRSGLLLPFSFSPSFAFFYCPFKDLIYAPFVHPSTPCPSVPLTM